MSEPVPTVQDTTVRLPVDITVSATSPEWGAEGIDPIAVAVGQHIATTMLPEMRAAVIGQAQAAVDSHIDQFVKSVLTQMMSEGYEVSDRWGAVVPMRAVKDQIGERVAAFVKSGAVSNEWLTELIQSTVRSAVAEHVESRMAEAIAVINQAFSDATEPTAGDPAVAQPSNENEGV